MKKKFLIILLAFFYGEHEPARAELLKALPAVGGGAWYYMTLNEWVAIATIGYIVLQAAYLARKWWREERKGRT